MSSKKILVTGTGNTGKSTWMQQLSTTPTSGFIPTDEEEESYDYNNDQYILTNNPKEDLTEYEYVILFLDPKAYMNDKDFDEVPHQVFGHPGLLIVINKADALTWLETNSIINDVERITSDPVIFMSCWHKANIIGPMERM